MKRFKLALSAVLMLTATMLTAQENYGSDSTMCKKNIALFYNFYEIKSYSDAYEPYKKIISICPKGRKGVYIKGATMFKKLIKAEKDDARKATLADSLIQLYDLRIENFGQEGIVLGYKGRAMFRYKKDQPCEAKEVMKKSIEMRGNKSQSAVISDYYRALYACYKLGNAPLEDLFSEYLSLTEVINHNLETRTDSSDIANYSKAKKNLDEFFVDVANCEDIIRIFKKRVQANPDDFDAKKKALKVMSSKECDDDPFYLEIAEAVHSQEPSHESAYALAIKYAKTDIDKALTYFEEAVNLCDGCAEYEKYLEKAAFVAAVKGKHGKAGEYAQKLRQLNPNNSFIYIVKGKRLMSRGAACDDGKAGRYGPIWLAADAFQKAVSLADRASVKKAAKKALAGAKANFPTTRDLFQFSMTAGASYSVKCEGGASTIVRAK